MFQDNNIKDYYDQNFENIVYNNNKLEFKIFEECTFINCNFSETAFKNCKFRYCQFINCNLSLITVVCCNFLNVKFNDCKIIGVNWTYSEALCSPIIFSKCNISQSNFLGLNLKSISITECVAREDDFRECDLSKAILTMNDFKNTLFCNTNLIKADFTSSTNYAINVLNNKIQGAKFSLPDVISLLSGIGIEIT
jgi:uncharacterized protein YjbI with pentapeptide repeats